MKNKLDITTLKDYPIFNNLKENEINIFSKKITIKKFSKNEIILKEGEEGNSVLFLLEGDISITQALTLKTNKFDNREKELIRINSNTQKFTFGEISLLNEDKKRTATVKTNSKCVIGELDFSNIFKICESDNSVGYKIMKNISSIITKQLIQSNTNLLKLTTAFSLIVND